MATERSDEKSWAQHPDQLEYDLNYHKEILLRVKGKVLDLGCGAGILSSKIASKDEVEIVYAVDKFPAWQRSYKAGPKLASRECNLTKDWPDLPKQFDTVVATEFIEHITREELLVLLPKIKEVLKGEFIGTTPIKVQPTKNPYHLQEYTMEELREVLAPFFKDIVITNIGNYCQLWIAQ